MDLTHDFTVPASVDETWQALNDIESVAGCFPGATITSADGDSFEGTCKVKLGPIALVYKGSGTFAEKDETARRLTIEAKGKDRRGNGTASADVTASLAEADGSGTRVTVVTDLTVTGKPAQFGRGMMQDVSDKLLGQFVDCLSDKLSGQQQAPAGDTAAGAATAAAGTTTQVADGQPVGGAADAAPPPSAAATSGPSGGSAASSENTLDLGATLLPVLAKNYWRQAAGALAGLLVLGWLVRRIRH